MAFIPLVSLGRVIGKFMLYFDEPRELAAEEQQLALVIASQVAFAVERMRAEDPARRSEERLLLRSMPPRWAPGSGTSPATACGGRTISSASMASAGTFDGTFKSYEREIHPDDRERVLAPCGGPSMKARPTKSSTASSRPTARSSGSKARGASNTSMAGRCA